MTWQPAFWLYLVVGWLIIGQLIQEQIEKRQAVADGDGWQQGELRVLINQARLMEGVTK